MDRKITGRLLGALLVAVVIPACSGDGKKTSAAESKESTAPKDSQRETATSGPDKKSDAPRPSAGCTGVDVAAGPETKTINVEARDRTYRQFVPEGYDGSAPLPLVLDTHGITSNADQQATITQFEALAAEEDFIVTEPNGIGLVRFWNVIETPLAANDVAFLEELVARTGATLCIDLSRVYATGMSNGGLMAHLLACRAPETFAAVAAVASALHPAGCEDSSPVAVLGMHGDEDPILPRAGGLGALVKNLLNTQLLLDVEGGLETQRGLIPEVEAALHPAPDAMADWVRQYECAAKPKVEEVSSRITTSTWTGCRGDVEVVFYDMAGTGHVWPRPPGSEGGLGAFGAVVGPDNDEIDATEVIWDFFSRYRR